MSFFGEEDDDGPVDSKDQLERFQTFPDGTFYLHKTVRSLQDFVKVTLFFDKFSKECDEAWTSIQVTRALVQKIHTFDLSNLVLDYIGFTRQVGR